MYLDHYKLKSKPFTVRPDAAFYYQSESHQAAQSVIEYAIAQAGIAVITGGIGTGKTSLIQTLANNYTDVRLVSNTGIESYVDLLRWMLVGCDIAPVDTDDVTLQLQLIDVLRNNERLVFVIDEAHTLSIDCLERLRMLFNISDSLQLVLAGQPELCETLSNDRLLPLIHRVAVDCQLEPLKAVETSAYINHRLTIAGCEVELFDESAADEIHKCSGGNPRIINHLCDMALMFGYPEQCETIGRDIIIDVVSEKRQGLQAAQLQPASDTLRSGIASDRYRAVTVARQ